MTTCEERRGLSHLVLSSTAQISFKDGEGSPRPQIVLVSFSRVAEGQCAGDTGVFGHPPCLEAGQY